MRLLSIIFLTFFCFGQSIVVETGTYTGNATNPRTITTINSLVQDGKAVFVLVKSNSTNYETFRTDDMPADSSLHLWPALSWEENAITSFSETGFVVNSYLNANTIAHYWVAIVSDTVLMTTRKYVGTGANADLTFPFAPGLFIVKPSSAVSRGVWRDYSMGADSIVSVDGASSGVGLQDPGFSGNIVKLDNGATTNSSGKTYYAMCVKNDANFLAAVKYTGTGAAYTVNFHRSIPSVTTYSLFSSATNSTNIPSAWKTDDMTTNVIARIINNSLFNGYENVTTSSVDVNTSVITNTLNRKYEGWIVTSYTTPTEETTTGKFKGNSAYDKFKGW